MAEYSSFMLAQSLRYGHPQSTPNSDGIYPVRGGPYVPPPRNASELEQQYRAARTNGQMQSSPHLLGGHRGESGLPHVPPLPSTQMEPETARIVLQPQSQPERDALAQDASSAGVAAQTAALSALPVGRIVQGARAAANLIPQAVSAAPRTAAAATALGGARAAPRKATPPQNTTAGPTEPGTPRSGKTA